MTFDYNYVRVFGAAVKKCVCGSPHCRGYIGGDPLNAEVIVQDDSDDEYPEPVMLHGDADMNHKQDNSICATSAISVAEIKIQGKPPKNRNTMDESFAGNQDTSHQTHMNSIVGLENVNLGNSVAVVSLNAREESENFPDGSPASSLIAETSVALEASECMSHSSVQPVETSLSLKDTCETMSGVTKECSVAGEVSKNSFSSTQEFEVTSLDAVVSKSLRKSKSSNGRETHDPLKPCPFVKTSRESSLVKKVKQRNNAVNSRPLPDVDSMLQVSQPKFKKPPDGSLHGHFEAGMSSLSFCGICRLWSTFALSFLPEFAVEEKLNELLDHNGGISKRKVTS